MRKASFSTLQSDLTTGTGRTIKSSEKITLHGIHLAPSISVWISPQDGHLVLESLPASVQVYLLGHGQKQFIVKDKLRNGECFDCWPIS